MGAKKRQRPLPKRTMSVMKGLRALADLASGIPVGPSKRRYVAKATAWIAAIDAWDQGDTAFEPEPPDSEPDPEPDPEEDCVGDT